MSRRSVLSRALLSASLGALATHSGGAFAAAEEAEDEIVVTAQRRTESLQEVAISASVLTGDKLAEKGVQGIYALQYAAPALTMADYGSANVLNIRGIGRSAVDIELPSGVVLYRDGVPTFPGYFQNEPYYDIEAIEVLRGPQGTFVGKSAAGGAIFIRTASPKLDGFSGKLEGEYGNYDQFGATAVVNAPLSDTLGVRVAYRHFERNDILGESLTGNFTGEPGRPNLDSIRLGVLWEPTENFNSELRLDLSDLDFGGNLTSSYNFPLYDYVQNARFIYRDRSARVVGKMGYEFDSGLQITSVSGYQTTETVNNFDRNGASPAYDEFRSAGTFTLYSQEFNLISPDDADHPLSYVLGVFYQRTDTVIEDYRDEGFNFYLSQDGFPYLGLETPYKKQEDEWSVFADVKYRLNDQVSAELGIRYTNYQTTNDTNIVLGDGLSIPTIPFFVGMQKLDESDVDGKFTLTYSPNSDHNLFASVARAHITGGFNIVGGAEFDKSIVYSYEAGLKSSWMDDHIRTQLAAYYQTLSNYQAQFASPTLGGQNILQNAQGKSKIYGVEASGQANFGNLNIDAAFSFMESELGDFPDVVSPFLMAPNNVISISGAKTPFSPKTAVNVGASYNIDLGSFTVTPRVDLSHQAKQLGALFDAPQTRLPKRTLLNAGVRFTKDNIYVDVWGTNLTDERYVAGIQDLGNIWYPGPPRQYGVKVGVNF